MPFISVAPASEKLGFSKQPPPGGETGGTLFGPDQDDPQGHDREGHRDAPEVMLYKVLRPMFISMRIVGLYAPHAFEAGFPDAWLPPQDRFQGSFQDMLKMKEDARYQETSKDGGGCRAGCRLGLAFTVLLILLAWAFAIRSVVEAITAPTLDLILSQGVFGSWMVYATLLGMFFFLNSWRGKDGWAGFLWAYRKVHGPGGLDDRTVNLSKRTVGVSVTIAWFAILANFSFVGYLMFFTPTFDGFLYPFHSGQSYFIILKALVMGLNFFLLCYWILSLTTYFLVLALLSAEFSAYNERMSRAVTKCPVWFCHSFACFRKLHQRLSDLVTVCDSLFSGLMATSLIFNTVIICCQLYTILFINITNPFVWFTTIFWLGCGLGTLFSVAVVAAWIKEKAHEPFDIFHDLELTKVTPEFALQLNMFTKKLIGSFIGLSAAKMLVVDKGAVLTVIGLLVTYFVVILQFRPSSTSATSCDCAELIANLTLQCFSSAVTTSAP